MSWYIWKSFFAARQDSRQNQGVDPLGVEAGELERDETAIGDPHGMDLFDPELIHDQPQIARELIDEVGDVLLRRLALTEEVVEDHVVVVDQLRQEAVPGLCVHGEAIEQTHCLTVTLAEALPPNPVFTCFEMTTSIRL
jgi:hypothetical protein